MLKNVFMEFIIYCKEHGTNSFGSLSRLFGLIGEAAGGYMNTVKISAMEKNAKDAKNYVI